MDDSRAKHSLQMSSSSEKCGAAEALDVLMTFDIIEGTSTADGHKSNWSLIESLT